MLNNGLQVPVRRSGWTVIPLLCIAFPMNCISGALHCITLPDIKCIRLHCIALLLWCVALEVHGHPSSSADTAAVSQARNQCCSTHHCHHVQRDDENRDVANDGVGCDIADAMKITLMLMTQPMWSDHNCKSCHCHCHCDNDTDNDNGEPSEDAMMRLMMMKWWPG